MIPVDAPHSVSRVTSRDRIAWAANIRMNPPAPGVCGIMRAGGLRGLCGVVMPI
jgi:hypothetical protein